MERKKKNNDYTDKFPKKGINNDTVYTLSDDYIKNKKDNYVVFEYNLGR